MIFRPRALAPEMMAPATRQQPERQLRPRPRPFTRGAGPARAVRTARARPRPCASAPAKEAAMSCDLGRDGGSPDIAAAALRARLRRDGW